MKREFREKNPVTGEDMMLASIRVVTFRCSGKLVRINKEYDSAVD